MNKLNEELREKAIRLGLCRQWQRDWREDWSKKVMVDKFFEGIDFCIENNYPSNDFIKTNFELDFLRKEGVYVDDKYSNMNLANAAVFGLSDVTLRYSAMRSGRIWVKDNAKLRIVSHNFAFVMVHIFDDAKIVVERFDKSNVVLVVHSSTAHLEYNKGVVIKEELDYLR